MKKLLLVVVLFVGCKKEQKDQVTITVLESGTTIPVSGASVRLIRYHLDFTSETTFGGVTDENGKVYIDAKIYDRGLDVIIEKDKYYEVEERKNTTLYMTPEGWLKVQLHPVGEYPAGTSLQLSVRTQEYSTSGDFREVTAGTDSAVLLRGFGGLPNEIVWQVHGDSPDAIASGVINNLQVPRLDTLRVNTLEY